MKQKFVPLEKQSKKAQKEYNKMNRVVCNFNTGNRIFKTVKNPTRAMLKDTWIKKELTE